MSFSNINTEVKLSRVGLILLRLRAGILSLVQSQGITGLRRVCIDRVGVGGVWVHKALTKLFVRVCINVCIFIS